MSKNVVFSQPWGGLGDNIQYSNLPLLYSYWKNFYISRFNFVRSKEVEELVGLRMSMLILEKNNSYYRV